MLFVKFFIFVCLFFFCFCFGFFFFLENLIQTFCTSLNFNCLKMKLEKKLFDYCRLINNYALTEKKNKLILEEITL